MCREEIKGDQNIDNALLFAWAKLNKHTEIEDFLSNPNSADVTKVFNNKLLNNN